MGKEYTAVLIDMISIQNYVFGSNKLKINIGASYIIENEVYGEVLKGSIDKVTGTDIKLEEWGKTPDKGLSEKVEIGYIGGGNALVLFEDKSKAEEFVRTYSQTLLKNFPGLNPVFAIVDNITLSDATFKEDMNLLQTKLRENRQIYFNKNTPFKSGITKDCHLTGELAEFSIPKEANQISGIALAKINAFDRAKVWYAKTYANELKDKYEFPLDFSDMGVDKEKGYIAVVHVDGNSMGKKFMECSTLSQFRKLSSEIKKISQKVIEQMVDHIVYLYEQKDLGKEIKLNDVNKTSGKKYLPFRPIISGGDDFTFVCEGRLGVYLTEKLISLFGSHSIENEKLSSCGGISLVKTKYPFFRAYNLCEQLTSEAKKLVKKNPNGEKNALHFTIAGSGFIADDYDQMVNEKFMINGNKLLVNGPYFIENDKPNVSTLKKKMDNIKYGNSKWPMNKIKELRKALTLSEASQKYFIYTMKARGLDVSAITDFGNDELWKLDGGVVYRTPLFDIFELLNFYPKTLLK